MQMFLNKKNLNRISRKSATLIQASASYDKTAHSTISTFRQIKQTKKLLEDTQISKPPPIKMENILSFCHNLSSRRKHFSLLSKPKVNFKNQNCQRNTAHDQSYQTARQRLTKSTRKPDFLNRTISYTTTRQQKINSLYNQDPIDLQRDEFKRKHESLKKYEMDSSEELNQISHNTILSNNLGKLSVNQIIEIKQNKQKQKDFLTGLTKFGQLLSNEAAQTDEFRELFISLPNSSKYSNTQLEKSKKLDESTKSSMMTEGLDKKVLEKYGKLLNSIHESESKYPTESYDDYDKALSGKHISHRQRKRNTKILINCGEEWRS